MIVDAKTTEELAPAGMVRVDVMGFMRFTAALYAESWEQGRAYLTWEQWNAWGKAAIAHKIIRREDLVGEPEPHVPENCGMPIRGRAPDPLFFRYAIIKTWRRVREAKQLGLTPLQFHNDETAAMKRDAERAMNRDKQNAIERAAAQAASQQKPRSHKGAAGDEL